MAFNVNIFPNPRSLQLSWDLISCGDTGYDPPSADRVTETMDNSRIAGQVIIPE